MLPKWGNCKMKFKSAVEFLRNVRARDPAEAERRIGTARENIRDLERRLQVLRKEQQELIVQAVNLGERKNH